ncbi:PDC sensor domain-containing protein [Algoriphagus namhaensis]|uniref:PDC sensor domain-containing protein n=1 Tax=Algoriphagus namhaensis TaxID=915353 RepID=A0ABV8AXB2_9BACT
MRRLIVVCVWIWICSCESPESHSHQANYDRLKTLINGLEGEGKSLMQEIDEIARFSEKLLVSSNQSEELRVDSKYTIVDGISTNRPGDGSDLSTIYISQLATDMPLARKEVLITNSLDSVFKDLVFKYPLVSQVYTNSVNQVSRVYPSYDAVNLLDPDLDVTTFNFFYEADESHNPERVPRWLPDPYIDPAGRGWIVSLVTPIYHEEKLHSVLGIDFRIEEVLSPFLESFDGDYLVVTGKGDIVAGSPQAINKLGFPPLRNHVYRETIRSNNFRISDYNLYNSKSPEVRDMAQSLLLSSKEHFEFENEGGLTCAISSRFELVDWLLIEIFN